MFYATLLQTRLCDVKNQHLRYLSPPPPISIQCFVTLTCSCRLSISCFEIPLLNDDCRWLLCLFIDRFHVLCIFEILIYRYENDSHVTSRAVIIFRWIWPFGCTYNELYIMNIRYMYYVWHSVDRCHIPSCFTCGSEISVLSDSTNNIVW